MKLKAQDSVRQNGSTVDEKQVGEVDLDRLIKWTLLFAIVYFGASLLLK